MLAVGRSSRQWNRSTHEHCTCTLHGPDGCRWCSPISKVHTPQPLCAHIFLKCTPISKVHSALHTPETPCASCCLIVSRWLLMSSRAVLLLVLIAHSGRCVWNKYAGHPSKWKSFSFPSCTRPAYDQYKIAIYLLDMTNNSSARIVLWTHMYWDILKCNMLGYSGILLFAVPDGADYDSLTINCGKCH